VRPQDCVTLSDEIFAFEHIPWRKNGKIEVVVMIMTGVEMTIAVKIGKRQQEKLALTK
jgi:hypothetical protein